MGDGLLLSVGCKKINDQKGKRIVNGPGLVKNPKRAWQAKRNLGVSGVSVSATPSSSLALLPAPMILDVAQNYSLVFGDSFGGVIDLVLTSEVEKGEIALWDVDKEALSGGEINPLVSLAPLDTCVHLLESVPLSLKPILQVQNLLNAKMADCLVVADSGKLHQEVLDEEDFVEPRLQLEIYEGNALMRMWGA